MSYKICCDICKKELKEKEVVRIVAETYLQKETKEVCINCYSNVFYPDLLRKKELDKLNKLAGIKCD